jgi:hypothetical protein
MYSQVMLGTEDVENQEDALRLVAAARNLSEHDVERVRSVLCQLEPVMMNSSFWWPDEPIGWGSGDFEFEVDEEVEAEPWVEEEVEAETEVEEEVEVMDPVPAPPARQNNIANKARPSRMLPFRFARDSWSMSSGSRPPLTPRPPAFPPPRSTSSGTPLAPAFPPPPPPPVRPAHLPPTPPPVLPVAHSDEPAVKRLRAEGSGDRQESGGSGVDEICAPIPGYCPNCHVLRSHCFKAGDWLCSRCGNHNYSRHTSQCSNFRCSAPRASEVAPTLDDREVEESHTGDRWRGDESDWCIACKKWKSQCVKKNDWFCKCGNHCFARKMALSRIQPTPPRSWR